jgi:hypothetical protein
MPLRMTTFVVILALLADFSWSQSESTKPATYILESVKISNAAYPYKRGSRRYRGE